jgi:hypothetical protein
MTAPSTKLSVDSIRDLVRPTEPSASVYLREPSRRPADSGEDMLLRRRAIATTLRGQGADDATVAAVDGSLDGLPYPVESALFAMSGQTRLAQPVPGAVAQDNASFGAPAKVAPLLSWLHEHPAHVVVLTDRTGADITSTPAGALQGVTRTVTGPDDEIERNAPGGWAQARYQRRAEDSWQHNASAVAGAVAAELAGTQSNLVILAGDVRARQLLTDQLTRFGVPPEIELIPGGRSPDGSAARRPAAIREALRSYSDRQAQATIERFNEARGQQGTAVVGEQATFAALAAARVQTLLVADDPADNRIAWFDAAGWCGSDPTEPRPADAMSGPLVDIAIRAALQSNAQVLVLPADQSADLVDGIGAICWYR